MALRRRTQTLPGLAGIANGRGKYVTIYDRTVATVRVWVKKKKIVTDQAGEEPRRRRRACGQGEAGQLATQFRFSCRGGSGEWTTVHLTKLVPSADTTNNDEHVIIDLDGQWWESGGSTADGGAATSTRS